MQQPLSNALSLIENIYDDSMYGAGDMFRIKDVIHSLSSNQVRSKEWLAYEFKKQYFYPSGKILIIGGWYGLLAYMLRQRFPGKEMNIVSIDKDPMCETIAWKLFPDMDAQFITTDVFDFDLSEYSAIISTSVEPLAKATFCALPTFSFNTFGFSNTLDMSLASSNSLFSFSCQTVFSLKIS